MAPAETTEPTTSEAVVIHEKSDQPAGASQDALSKSGQSSEPSIEDEPVPHLHAKTFLIVFAVCFIYFAQLINVVGAGAVRIHTFPITKTVSFNRPLLICTASTNDCPGCWWLHG